MSLLNEALRKKRGERQPEDNALNTSAPKPNNRSNRSPNLKWRILICLLVLSAATCGALFYFDHSGATSDLSAGMPSADIEDMRSTPPPETQGKNDPKAAPPTIASVSPAALESQVSKAEKPPMQTNSKPLPPNTPDALKTKPTPAKELSKIKRSSVPRKKLSKTAPPPERLTRKKPLGTKAKSAAGTPAKRTVQSDRLYLKARQYHRQNRIDDAIALYQEVIRINPEHYKARFNLSAAYLQTEAYTQAYPIIADLYAKEPYNQQVMLNLAIAHIGCHRYPEALELLNKAAGQPDAPLFEIAFHKAVAYSHLNQAHASLNWYKQAEAIKPDDPKLLFNLAVVYDQEGKYAAAAAYYRRYLDHHSDIERYKKRQIRQRIRTLLTYREANPKEKSSDEKTHR